MCYMDYRRPRNVCTVCGFEPEFVKHVLSIEYPLMLMTIHGETKYPDLIAEGLGVGIRPWLFDVQQVLTSLKICESV